MRMRPSHNIYQALAKPGLGRRSRSQPNKTMKPPPHYNKPVTPWDLEKHMDSSGNAFVDSRRTDAIEYCFRIKENLLEDLTKARHCLDEAIAVLMEEKGIEQEHSPASISDLFGSFRAELWEDDEFVITCKAGVIGHTIDKKASRWLPAWLNGALAEALSKAQQRSQTKKE
jgi:hypothetical protein